MFERHRDLDRIADELRRLLLVTVKICFPLINFLAEVSCRRSRTQLGMIMPISIATALWLVPSSCSCFKRRQMLSPLLRSDFFTIIRALPLITWTMM